MSLEAVQTYVAQVGNVLTAMIVCVVVLMYVVFMELRPAVKEMQSEKEGYTARLTTCADSGLGNNTTQCWGDDSLLRGGRDGFLGYSEPPVFYDIGDLTAIRKEQRKRASEMRSNMEERASEMRSDKEESPSQDVMLPGKEEFSRYEKIHEGMTSDEKLLAMQ